MRRHLIVLAALVAVGAVVLSVAPGAGATGAVRAPWKNCKQVNSKYPHGVGKLHAHDKTKGTPVTTFRRSTRLYLIAMRNNSGLDRDKDGIACEKL
jgi:Excalibur calcium-binding domain